MDIVTVDFETHYSKEYSLSKMTTEAYVRDPRFEVIGVAVKVNDGPTDWYSGSDPGRFLRSLDYSKRAILCHNAAFDGAILSWHYGIKPRLWLDTLSMARPDHAIKVGGSLAKLSAYYNLGQKGDEVIRTMGKRRADFTPDEMDAFARYACTDADLTYKLFNVLKKQLPVSELVLIDQTIRMYTEPSIELDVDLLTQHLQDVRTKKADLLNELSFLGSDEAVVKTNLMSNEKLARTLSALGVSPPMKNSKATGQLTFAFSKTDRAFTDLLEHDDPRVRAIVAARLGVKSTLEETRTVSLMGVAERGPLPIMLNYYGAHTGRFSGGDKMNLQNLPRGGTLRKALKAPKGKKFIACDSAQIEARIVAWLAGQENLLSAFREGRDVYCEFATDVYGYPVTKGQHPLERHVGKTAVLGLGYGMGYVKFKATLEMGTGGMKVVLSDTEASDIVRKYRTKYPRIQMLWDRCNWALAQMAAGTEGDIKGGTVTFGDQHIRLPNGMKLHYPMLTRLYDGWGFVGDNRTWRTMVKNKITGEEPTHANWTYVYGGKVTENIVQALARIVVCEQMNAISQHFKVVLQVHDEVVCLVDEHEVDDAKDIIEQIMRTPPSWAPDLPVNCEAKVGANYGEAK